MFHLINRAKHLPNRMPAQEVILLAQAKTCREMIDRGRAHQAMMNTGLLRERPRLPTLHPRRQHRDNVDATALERPVSADCFITLTAKHLAGARNVFDAAETKIIALIALGERSTADAEFRVRLEFAQEKLVVMRIKSYVRIQASHQVELKSF